MAQSNPLQQTDIVSTYPPPPAKFYTLYTDENIAQNRVPPPPPIPTTYFNIFGAQYHTDDITIRDLEDMGIQKVYNGEGDNVEEMKKLNKSILITFLDLLNLLSKNPTSLERIKKIDHLKLLFINLHHLVNEYRPHQAREMLRTLIEHQAQDKLNSANRIRNAVSRVQSAFTQCDLIVKNSLAQKEATNFHSTELKDNNNETTTQLNPLRSRLKSEVTIGEELNDLNSYIGSLFCDQEDNVKDMDS